MRHLRTIAAAAAVLTAIPAAASAADITRTYDVTASDFESMSATLGPIQVFAASYTLTFDPNGDVAPTTSGLTVNYNSMPATTEYSYIESSDSLSLGTDIINNGAIVTNNGQYGLFIEDATSTTPSVYEVLYQTASGFYVSNVQSVAVTSTSAAPEPAAWALMLAGVGLMGGALRTRRQAGRTAMA